jgi:hypothetical protein
VRQLPGIADSTVPVTIHTSALVGIVALSIAFAGMSHAQQPDVRPYETEEDLWEAFREGEITEDEYLRLRETYRVGTDSVFVPASDWEELPGSGVGYLSPVDTSMGIPNPEKPPESTNRPIRIWWRNGYDGRLSAPTGSDGYVTGRIEGAIWRGLLNWKQDDRGARWQRRAFEHRSRGVKFQVGNVEPRWGRGLVVGRRSRLVGARKSNRSDGNFWQPALSRFNGFWLNAHAGEVFLADLLLSDIRSTNLTERMAGVQLVGGGSHLRAGLAALTGKISRTDTSGAFIQRVLGGHVQFGSKARALLAEVAVARNGASAKAAETVWRFERGRFHGRAWSYSPEFVNPWGGGPSHNDRSTIKLDGIDESYSSRTTGERGFSLSTRLDPQAAFFGGRMSARWEWMTHRGAHDPFYHSWNVQMRWKRKAFSIRPFVRGATEEGVQSRHALGFFTNYGSVDRRLSARLEYGRHHSDADPYVRAGAGAKWRLNPTVRLEPAFRWVDPDLDRPGDGYWYFYFTEVIFPASAWRIEAALVWQHYERRDREDMVELRLRMVAGRL